MADHSKSTSKRYQTALEAVTKERDALKAKCDRLMLVGQIAWRDCWMESSIKLALKTLHDGDLGDAIGDPGREPAAETGEVS